MSPVYQKRRDISKELTEQRSELKKAAHAARQELARARKFGDAIKYGMRYLRDLSQRDSILLDDLNAGKLARVRDECGAALGWNQQMRNDAGTAAGRLCSQ